MEEPQKGPSSFKRKEKKSFLDEDIGNDFLSSWKSLSVAEDDAMDFSFDTVSNGKKNTFNFEKLDMDFNLDGDFDKLSSFKVDMSDFDFPGTSKKAAKPKERSEDESSTGNPQGKKNRFDFSFDYNQLDSFNFESSAKEVKASSKKQNDKMEVSSDGSGIEHRDPKLQPDDIAMKLPASENVATANSETLLGGPGSLNSMKKDAAKYVSSGAPILSNSDRSSPEKAMSNRTEAIDKQIHLSENAIFEEVYSQHAVLDFPGQSLNGIDSSKDTFKDGLTESCRRGPRVDTTSSRRVDVNEKLMASVSTYHEDLPSKNSSFIDGVTESCQRGARVETASSQREDVNEKFMAGVSSYHRDLCSKNSSALNITASGSNNGVENKSCSDISTENVDGNESAEGREENSTSSISRKVLCETENNKENCSSKAELPAAHLCSEPMVDQVTLTNEIEAGGLHQKFSKREGAAPLIRQSSPFEATSFSSGIERTGPSCKSPANKTEEDSSSNDTQTGPELCHNPVSIANELKKVEDVLPMSERSVKNLNNIGKGLTSDNLPNGGRLVGKLLLNGKEATRRISVIPASDRNAKDQNSFGLQVSSSSSLEKQGKFSTHAHANSKPFVRSMESLQFLKIKPIEGDRHSLVRGGKKTADLASVKIFKSTAAADKVLSDLTPQKDTSSLQNTVQNVDVEGSTALETSHPFNSNEKKSPMSLSLKRKTFELSNSDLSFLKPPKRLSESPTKSRDSKEPLTRAVEEKLCSAGKSFKPLKCLPEAVTESRDVKGPLQRVDVKETFKKIDGEKVSIDKNQLENKTESILYNVPAFAIETPQQVKMMEFEISSIMKNDGNVEKAEAYAKELDDICNMLKKKHEEAKEILVRAIVNNNELLMLNHPIYEEKIHKVQKFAAELMSKELKA